MTLATAITCFYYLFVDRRGALAGLFFFEVKNDFIGSLYLLAFLYATLRLGLAGAVVSWFVCFGAVLPRLAHYSVGAVSQMYNTLLFLVPLLIAITVLLEVRWRDRHARLAADRERERHLHIDRVFRAQEEERHRIAQGLHDDVLQRILAIAYMAENLSTVENAPSGETALRAAEIRTESLHLAEDLRRLSYDLRPSMLDSLGLFSAVGWLSKRLQQETGIRARLLTGDSAARFPPLVETTAFRLVQEALNNVRSHSSASEVVIALKATPDRLEIDIKDNGVGFAAGRAMQQAIARGHLGLLGMKERAESLGGTVSVTSRSGRGTRVVATIPLGASSSDEVTPQTNSRLASAFGQDDVA